jgi:hypothetical protein
MSFNHPSYRGPHIPGSAYKADSAAKNFELVDCEDCGGTGKLKSGTACPTCMGHGEYEKDTGEPEQPRKRKAFDDPPVKDEGTPARKQGTTPNDARGSRSMYATAAEFADLERSVDAAARRRGYVFERRASLTVDGELSSTPVMRRRVSHGDVDTIEKGSNHLVARARAVALERNVSLEEAMILVARETPSLVRG